MKPELIAMIGDLVPVAFQPLPSDVAAYGRTERHTGNHDGAVGNDAHQFHPSARSAVCYRNSAQLSRNNDAVGDERLSHLALQHVARPLRAGTAHAVLV